MTPDEINKVYREADCLYDRTAVENCLEQLASKVTERHGDNLPVMLCVMSGALIPAGILLSRLDFPLEIDYIHATRYLGETRGGDIQWKVEPHLNLRDREVIIIDDILDEGLTLAAIIEYCKNAGASQVFSLVLVEKLHQRKNDVQADYVGLQIEDRYVFGYGMDYKGYLRNANGIYAVRGM